MEQCAYISASRMRAAHILTASMDSVTFARSTKVGDILYITSQVGLDGAAGGFKRKGAERAAGGGFDHRVSSVFCNLGDIFHITSQAGLDGTQQKRGIPFRILRLQNKGGQTQGKFLSQRALLCTCQGW